MMQDVFLPHSWKCDFYMAPDFMHLPGKPKSVALVLVM